MSEEPTRWKERHLGREAALQLLYQWDIGGLTSTDVEEAIVFYWVLNPAPESRKVFATGLVRGTSSRHGEIDQIIEANTENWRLSRMAVLDRLILRMAIYELLCDETPPLVVIDEALELAKTFSGSQAVGFINGVLDSARREIVGERKARPS